MGDNSISCIATDPPYGLKFMGKEWDHGIPAVPFWQEMLRICKPGAFLLSFGGTRTFHRLTCAIEDAGWEIRDCLSWLYGSGFPKSHNHFGIDGYGTALKPAWEPIIMAMKPCEGTFKQNAEKWGQAGINIDDCRIETAQKLQGSSVRNDFRSGNFGKGHTPNPGDINDYIQNEGGRWPANLILDEEAATMLDEQSGNLKGNTGIKGNFKGQRHNGQFAGGGQSGNREYNFAGYHDNGGASRFFYCAKASSSERNEGCDCLPDKIGGGLNATVHGDYRTGNKTIQKNNHPTVKPLKLMEYLITLVMPPKDGILLDPFAGSGTTILAAQRLGFDAIGIEKNEEYCEIARKRIETRN